MTIIDDWAFKECSRLTSIIYRGSKAQWEALSKGRNWNEDSGYFTIHCTDGDLDKNSNEI